MPVVKIASEKLLEIRERLVKTAQLEKRAAELECENDVLRRTLGLVAEGQIDPAIALDKVAEFTADPDKLRVIEVALGLGGGDSTKIGSAVDADPNDESAGDGTSEDKFGRRLANIVASHQ